MQFIDDRQLFQALLLDQLLCVIYVLISLKAAHYSTHFQVDLELLLLILCVCESLEKTKSEIGTIHKRGLDKDLAPLGEKPVWDWPARPSVTVSCLTCCVMETKGLEHGTRAKMWACSPMITGRSS